MTKGNLGKPYGRIYIYMQSVCRSGKLSEMMWKTLLLRDVILFLSLQGTAVFMASFSNTSDFYTFIALVVSLGLIVENGVL